MSARKSNKPAQVQSNEPEVIEPVVETPVVEGPVVEEPVVDTTQADIERENKIVDLESEMVRLQDRIKEIRKELKGLESKTKREGPTKMELATKLWKEQPGLQRKDYVEKFQKDFGLTLAGARTYIQLIMTKNK